MYFVKLLIINDLLKIKLAFGQYANIVESEPYFLKQLTIYYLQTHCSLQTIENMTHQATTSGNNIKAAMSSNNINTAVSDT